MLLHGINWNPSRRQMQVFGLTMMAFFLLVGAVMQYAVHVPFKTVRYVYFFGLFACSACLSGVKVGLYVYRMWMGMAWGVGLMVSYALAVFAFYLVITPIGWGMRLFGRDRLVLATPSNSNWRDVKPHAPERQAYERPF